MKLLTNRKGFMYLVTVSILALIIIFVFLGVNRYTFQDKQEMQATRIQLMNDFVADFNQDVHRATYITSFRTLLALEDYIASNSGTFFNDTELAFQEAFFNGTINGSSATLLNASSFTDYLNRINFLAESIGLQSNMTVVNITLSHTGPWRVDVAVHMRVNITDTKNIAAWHFQEIYTTSIPIFDLRDPLYSKFTDNAIPNTIRQSPFPFLVNTSSNDTTHLALHVNGSYYLASSLAPSFLQRFENNLTPSPYGIESIVNIGDIAAQDKDVYENRIKVDFMYFNDLSADKICDVDTLSSSLYFVISDDRTLLYEIDGLDYNNATCP